MKLIRTFLIGFLLFPTTLALIAAICVYPYEYFGRTYGDDGRLIYLVFLMSISVGASLALGAYVSRDAE